MEEGNISPLETRSSRIFQGARCVQQMTWQVRDSSRMCTVRNRWRGKSAIRQVSLLRSLLKCGQLTTSTSCELREFFLWRSEQGGRRTPVRLKPRWPVRSSHHFVITCSEGLSLDCYACRRWHSSLAQGEGDLCWAPLGVVSRHWRARINESDEDWISPLAFRESNVSEQRLLLQMGQSKHLRAVSVAKSRCRRAAMVAKSEYQGAVDVEKSYVII